MSFVHNEYKALVAEYSNFVESIEIDKSSESPLVEIVTKEKGRLTVRLTSQGWTIVSSSIEKIEKDSIFETSEALLMQASAGFAEIWNDKLTLRLLQVHKERGTD